MDKKANHQANIVRITDIRPHTNADNLELIILGEYQVVSRKGQFTVGSLGVYLQPDSVVPQTEPFRFIWEPYMCVPVEAGTEFSVPEKRRRITVRKFRGEWSEGLLLPVSDFPDIYYGEYLTLHEGQDVSDILGITHYDPDAGKESTAGENMSAPKARKKGYPRSLRGWVNYITRRTRQLLGLEANTDGKAEAVSLGIPVYDVESMKNHKDVFQEGEVIRVTEKVHGSNARYVFHDGTIYAGSRTLWKAPSSNCVWRKSLKEHPWIEAWCRKHPDHVLWGEVTPTQGGYEYGSKGIQFFAFDIYTPDGKWADSTSPKELFIDVDTWVPVLYEGPYNEDTIKALVDGPSKVLGAKNIREGIVIRTVTERHVRGLGRAQLKLVSNKFLEKDVK